MTAPSYQKFYIFYFGRVLKTLASENPSLSCRRETLFFKVQSESQSIQQQTQVKQVSAE